MERLRSQLVGSWTLADWKVFTGDGDVDPPLGPAGDCSGLLIYTPEGTMSAHLTRTDRPRFADPSLDGGGQEEKADAYGSIISYAGTWEADETARTVTHHVTIATFPNFVDADLTRVCVFEDDDTLKLDTPPMAMGGEARPSHILWRRLPNPLSHSGLPGKDS
ncbi:lipocalin-like domain-containing protein [Streptomyces hokutonensis]|uniref:lipocalin-like domain-containing protein n=1 Tax=Streptomyces hokutonensis TaxID=1306990 RepID=UPI00382E3BEC